MVRETLKRDVVNNQTKILSVESAVGTQLTLPP